MSNVLLDKSSSVKDTVRARDKPLLFVSFNNLISLLL